MIIDKTIPIRTLNKSADKKQKSDPLCVYIQYGFSPIELYCQQNRHEEVLSVTNTHDLRSQRLQYYNHVFHSNDEVPLQFPHPADFKNHHPGKELENCCILRSAIPVPFLPDYF